MPRSTAPLRSPARRDSPPPRPRLSSKDIPRTYSGLYGDGNDLLPFELSRNRNTDWLLKGGWLLLCTYISIILLFHVLFMTVMELEYSFTCTHVTHFIVTMIYLHWIKGCPDFYEQGEMNAMTLWEQLESTSGTFVVKRALLIIPTLLCYAACHFANYDPLLSAGNILVWVISILAKMPFMNGVRILGINRTTGIDDDEIKRD